MDGTKQAIEEYDSIKAAKKASLGLSEIQGKHMIS